MYLINQIMINENKIGKHFQANIQTNLVMKIEHA